MGWTKFVEACWWRIRIEAERMRVVADSAVHSDSPVASCRLAFTQPTACFDMRPHEIDEQVDMKIVAAYRRSYFFGLHQFTTS